MKGRPPHPSKRSPSKTALSKKPSPPTHISKPHPLKPSPPRAQSGKATPQVPFAGGGVWLWGTHPVKAALENRQRECHQLFGTAESLRAFASHITARPRLGVQTVQREIIDQLLPPQALHQGIALCVSPLPSVFLDDFIVRHPTARRLVVLDHITDPHNLGAIVRSACAFGMDALLLTPRHSPPLEGVVAKSASGALDKIPLVFTSNLAHGLRVLREENFWCVGLAETGKTSITALPSMNRIALVLGAEGRGLRPLTMQNCDVLAHLPTVPAFPTLNVSAAAAVAFYSLTLCAP